MTEPCPASNQGVPPHGGGIGVLLVNLGTPDALGYWPVRRYLKEFLSDRRVVDAPRLIWWPILNLVILSRRPQRSSKNYETIWNRERNESPLKTVTRSQAEKLSAWIAQGGLGEIPGGQAVLVDWAMRYGSPSIPAAFEKLKARGCGRVLVVPLYPQYAGATTASVADKVAESLDGMRWRPELRSAAPYYKDPVYIDALAQSVRAELARLDFAPEIILVSFHGIPKSYVAKGDPYYDQCVETWRLLRARLQLSAEQMPLSFQSRFGPAQWLRPLHRRDGEGARPQGRQAHGRADAGIFRRLPRNHFGNRHREPRIFRRERRREVRADSLPQRQRARHGGDRSYRRAGACRVDRDRRVTRGGETARVRSSR